ncbi:MAG: GAF domain-containing protein, partial [Candidatus Acidiferrales bacterium]
MDTRKTKPRVREPDSKKSGRTSPDQEDKATNLRRTMEGFAVVHDMAKSLTSSLQLDQVLNTIMEKVEQLLQPDTWSLLLVDEKTNE